MAARPGGFGAWKGVCAKKKNRRPKAGSKRVVLLRQKDGEKNGVGGARPVSMKASTPGVTWTDRPPATSGRDAHRRLWTAEPRASVSWAGKSGGRGRASGHQKAKEGRAEEDGAGRGKQK
ncbi:unnamed protein product [Pleuronectes platessa]|uniref:Uncharacterized protein n=1 Tax=Pleuronectes platessa TaxID=8262 RepID=A0A9N7TL53_PLEPL|nr:unnamed protein product [Pleuronectes platessa]